MKTKMSRDEAYMAYLGDTIGIEKLERWGIFKKNEEKRDKETYEEYVEKRLAMVKNSLVRR